MIKKIIYIEGTTTSPYDNLALEEYLLFSCNEDECILFLWQNEKTVVIGRNQNAWGECNVSKLEDDGGTLVRRLSGGGAVFHDLGNLNFTFVTRSNHFDIEKQTKIIVNAIRKLGIWATCSGRNDIVVSGKKISGNAYYKQGAFCFHHGTLMYDVNIDDLSKYLNVPEEKLQSKGIKSVRARVGNLKEFSPSITLDAVKRSIVESFEDNYKMEAQKITALRIRENEIQKNRQKYMSWEWTYGRKISFEHQLSHRFAWGNVEIHLHIENGRIADLEIFSDAMRTEVLIEIKKYLQGIMYSKKSICAELSLYWSIEKEDEKMVKDVISWIKKEEL